MQHANDTTDDALTCHQTPSSGRRVHVFNTLVYNHRNIRSLQTAGECLCRSGPSGGTNSQSLIRFWSRSPTGGDLRDQLLTFVDLHSCLSTRLQESASDEVFSSLTPDRRLNETVSLSKRLWLEHRWKHPG